MVLKLFRFSCWLVFGIMFDIFILITGYDFVSLAIQYLAVEYQLDANSSSVAMCSWFIVSLFTMLLVFAAVVTLIFLGTRFSWKRIVFVCDEIRTLFEEKRVEYMEKHPKKEEKESDKKKESKIKKFSFGKFARKGAVS